MPAAGRDALCPAAQTMVDQALSTASISSWMVTLSLTTTPPPSMAAFQLTPKSLRLISAVAVKPARVPP